MSQPMRPRRQECLWVVPVIAGAADKACEVLGVGALELILPASLAVPQRPSIPRVSLCEVVPFMPAYPAALPEHFNTEIQVFRGFGWSVGFWSSLAR